MRPRPGFALVLSVLMILVVAVIGLGVLALGTREALVARTLERILGARASAESAARRELAAWSTDRWDALPVARVEPGVVSVPGARTWVERLDTGLFVIRSEAGDPGAMTAAVARAALLVRALPRPRLASAFPAALTAGEAPVMAGGHVAGGDSAIVIGAPQPAVDLLALAAAPGLATHSPPEWTASPQPRSSTGSCTSGAWNWGAISPAHPCHDLWPVVYVPHHLTLQGGEARGVLIVDGDLVLEGDLAFEGVILVRGRLTMANGAVTGAVRVGQAELSGGEIRRDTALVNRALGAPALDRAFRHAVRWWVPSF